MRHYLVNSYGCPVHQHVHTDRVCSCRGYWAMSDECSSKAWNEDHHERLCAEHGGACKSLYPNAEAERIAVEQKADQTRYGGPLDEDETSYLRGYLSTSKENRDYAAKIGQPRVPDEEDLLVAAALGGVEGAVYRLRKRGLI